ncbi:MAG: hypothetical protein GC192_08830 [Bacteroidetes bacterium]|nr:hypothetical protein [Bacteroidota bacterium]
MNTIIDTTIRKTVTITNTLLIGALWLVMSLFVMPEAMRQNSLYAKGAERIGSPLRITQEEFYGIIGQYGENGRQHFVAIELTADVFFDVVSSLFLCFLMVWSFHLSKNKHLNHSYLIRLASFILIVFLLENAGMVSMILTFPDSHKVLYYLTAAFSILKIALVTISLGIIGWNLAISKIRKQPFEWSSTNRKSTIVDET